MGNIGRATGNVGIGTTDPLAPLDVRGDILLDKSNILLPVNISGSGWAKGILYKSTTTDGDTNAVGGIGANGSVSGSIDRIYLGIGATPWSGTNSLYIKSDGKVGVGVEGPTAKLDVNGTLKVGDFGGATNVMPKPQHGTVGAIGHIMPYQTLTAKQNTQNTMNGIPAGTWFINLVWVENSDTAGTTGDRDVTAFMGKVIAVPSGQYFYIATNTEQKDPPGGAGATYAPPIYMKFANTSTITTPSSSDTLSSWTSNGWYQVKSGAGISEAEAKQYSTGSTFYGYVENNTGILVSGQNTGIGPGYGYIQRIG